MNEIQDLIYILQSKRFLKSDLIDAAQFLRKKNIKLACLDEAISSSDKNVILNAADEVVKVLQKEAISPLGLAVKKGPKELVRFYVVKNSTNKELADEQLYNEYAKVANKQLTYAQYREIVDPLTDVELEDVKNFIRDEKITVIGTASIIDTLSKFAFELDNKGYTEEATEINQIITNFFLK